MRLMTRTRRKFARRLRRWRYTHTSAELGQVLLGIGSVLVLVAVIALLARNHWS